MILLAQCVTWFVMVHSYRQLNAAKYQVVGVFEERLPAFAYSRAQLGRAWGGCGSRSTCPQPANRPAQPGHLNPPAASRRSAPAASQSPGSCSIATEGSIARSGAGALVRMG